MMPAPTPEDVTLGGEAQGTAEGIKARGIATPTLTNEGGGSAPPTTGQIWPRGN